MGTLIKDKSSEEKVRYWSACEKASHFFNMLPKWKQDLLISKSVHTQTRND